MTRTRCITLAKLGISLVLLFAVFRMIDLNAAWARISTLHPAYLAGVLALSCLGIAVNVWKWRMLLEPPPPFAGLLRLFWIGAFFNNFLPGRTGGDIVRVYGIADGTQNLSRAAVSVAIDRGINLAAMILIGLVALTIASYPIPQTLRTALLTGGVLMLVTGGAILFLARPAKTPQQNRWRRLAGQAATAVHHLSRQPLLLAKVSLLAVAYQIAVIIGNYGVARSLGIDIGMSVFFYAIPITALIAGLPVSINGFGLREGAYAVIFATVGLSAESAVSISLVATGCAMLISAIGGIFYAISPVRVKGALERLHVDTLKPNVKSE